MLNARRRVLVLAGVVTAVQLLTGCGKRDPLDRHIHAQTLAELNEWQNASQNTLGPALAGELQHMINNLAGVTPGFHQARDDKELLNPENPLCRRINDRTVRDVLIDGYDATNTALRSSNNLDAENLRRYAEVVDGPEADKLPAEIERIEKRIHERDDAIEKNLKRIAELSGTTK